MIALWIVWWAVVAGLVAFLAYDYRDTKRYSFFGLGIRRTPLEIIRRMDPLARVAFGALLVAVGFAWVML